MCIEFFLHKPVGKCELADPHLHSADDRLRADTLPYGLDAYVVQRLSSVTFIRPRSVTIMSTTFAAVNGSSGGTICRLASIQRLCSPTKTSALLSSTTALTAPTRRKMTSLLFLNIINEWYAKDTSNKIKIVGNYPDIVCKQLETSGVYDRIMKDKCKEDAAMPLSNEIKLLRQKSFLTQEAFASTIGVSTSTVIRWESGKVRPNLKAMKSIKDFCTNNSLPYKDIEKEWIVHDT